ncbi:MAG: SgcJ/EcaC family oxidoreductase [Actinobacteria bacterium]|jgi:uncharacterized protein (TIGR02246 family)|nr:SgcJ/EcaC family oxidoreductase [Actinomycetota bacterium]
MTNIGPLRTAVVIGSTRPTRLGRGVAEWVATDPNPDLDLVIVDLAEMNLPLLDEPQPPAWGNYSHESTRAWSAVVASFDAFVLVTPEYNHSTSAVLKNALDHLYSEWSDKAAAFVGYGIDGGTRGVEHLRAICSELSMAGVGPQVSLSLGLDFRDGRCSPREDQVAARGRMVAALARWGGALRSLRSTPERVGDETRPTLECPELRPRAAAAMNQLIAGLQAGLDNADADLFDASFAADVIWGSPYGATLNGIDALLTVHRSLMATGAAPASRFRIVQLRAAAPGVAVAHVQRQALGEAGEGFSEMALYVLVERNGRWWLAAGQNTPITNPPSR